ncbi:MAG: 3-methyl-2-oxobutanoate hydroxymethyltransferase [Candidatus Wallbacteria bacterium]|nr:3-methyl-2-oxobutanoate hydroxymethyltransferase [Candidatus Wallbacteria bacterium]
MKRVTTNTIKQAKSSRKIAAVTAYDFTMSTLVSESGIDIVLVGDSLAQCFKGEETTLGVTLEEMIYHTRQVARGSSHSLVVADLPFMSYQVSVEEGLRNAGRVLKETSCQAVKLEGGNKECVELIRRCVEAGIPVMGHLGLTPQSVNVFGGYLVQGASAEEEERIFREAINIESAGAFSLVLECVPYQLARNITQNLKIPTIGIGAGPYCDGQILVINDLLGLSAWKKKPRFVKTFADLRSEIRKALELYKQEICDGSYPDLSQSYKGGSEVENDKPA